MSIDCPTGSLKGKGNFYALELSVTNLDKFGRYYSQLVDVKEDEIG
jgi:hypothetical protein